MKQIPFFPNPDKTHCYQAAIRMILKYYWPDKDFTWEELDKITAKKDGLWTWPLAGIMWLKNQGFDVHAANNFDYQRFIKVGADYLIEHSGEEVGKEQTAHSDIDQERQYAKEAVKNQIFECRTPEITDLKHLLDQGYLVICNINSRTLNNKPGYVGHFVLVTSYNQDVLTLHDPGPEPRQNRKVDFAAFERAWAYPDQKNKDYIAVRKNT